tara:strand:+ start:505 stop:792 length:288 start_codon:yes stop_codon:yes gene_type:complete
MKQYNNGPRKGMMYGGATKRKPMMYGGMAKKPRKKAYGGGMMSAGQQNQKPMSNTGMMPAMAKGDLPMTTVNGVRVPKFAADGKGAKDLKKNRKA